MTSTVVDSSMTAAPKPRREFLGPLKSLVRSISGNNLAAKNKKLKNATAIPVPQPQLQLQPQPQRRPEKLVKGRRRASSFWSKKPTPPYYGDTHDLRCSSADQLASTLRESFRAVGFQNVTPYDNPALGTISRQPSSSRLSVHPLATPNVPTIIFSPKPMRSPSGLSPPSPWSSPSPSRSRPSSRPSSRPPSRPGTPGTTELRFDIPTFLPPRPKRSRSGSNSSSDYGSLRGTPQGSTVSLSQHLRSSGIAGAGPVQSPGHVSLSLPFLFSNHPASATSTTKNNMPPKSPDEGSSMWNTSGKQEPKSNSVLVLKSPVKAPPSPLRESSLTASLTEPVLFANGKTETEQTEVMPMSPLAIPQFPHLNDDGRPVSLAGSELSAPGLNKILTGFDEVDAQLHDMITQRGRELSDSVGSPEPPARPINFAVAV